MVEQLHKYLYGRLHNREAAWKLNTDINTRQGCQVHVMILKSLVGEIYYLQYNIGFILADFPYSSTADFFSSFEKM